jgi:hypothetical protein
MITEIPASENLALRPRRWEERSKSTFFALAERQAATIRAYWAARGGVVMVKVAELRFRRVYKNGNDYEGHIDLVPTIESDMVNGFPIAWTTEVAARLASQGKTRTDWNG